MKSEFITKPLSALADIQTGPFGSQLHKEDYVQTGTPIVTVEHLGKKKFTEQNLPRVSDADKERLSKYTLREGDVVFSRVGSVDRCSYVSDEYDGWMFSGRCLRVRPLSEIDSQYLYYYFTLESTKQFVHGIATGATMPSINTKFMGEVPVIYPPIADQHKIASVLSALDDKIELNNKINENLLQQAIALYEHLLQEAEWPTATILDVAKKVAMGPFGSNIKVSTFVPKGVPIISGNHLRGYFLEEPEFNYITEEHAERLKNSIVFPHDLIFTHAGNIGQVAMIPDRCKYDRYVLSQRQFYLRCDETKVVPEFLLLFFHSASGQHELLSYANQTGVPSIAQPASNLKKIPFKCPPMQEQLMWQEQVHPLLGQYLNNRLENERLSSLRDILLPKLMSGELDVSDLDL